jgi:hypothetical protein
VNPFEVDFGSCDRGSRTVSISTGDAYSALLSIKRVKGAAGADFE